VRFSIRFLFVLCGINLSAQVVTIGEIRGTITDQLTTLPVSNVLVTVQGTTLITHTDSKGEFVLNPVSPGYHDLYVHAVGYRDDTVRSVIVEAGKTTYLTCRIVPADYDERTKPRERIFRPGRAYLVGGAEAALITSSLVILNKAWYEQYHHESFHLFNDNEEWMQMDKIGHTQTAYTTGLIATGLWDWTGINHKKAVWIGGLTGFSYLTAIEIMDGYSTGWGFSSGDMIANATGSALFISQEFVWQEQRIQPKFGYCRTLYPQYRPDILGSNRTEEILKDYNGQTYWLSVNVASFLRDDTQFPQWLNFAFGYGANGMTGGRENPTMYNSNGNVITLNRYRQYYLSLDIDLTKIPVHSPVLHAIFCTFGFLKIPAPGIELSQSRIRPLLFAF